ncbi:5-formyltetrahydrofolate cyclo-ligase [Thioalkalivibrio nitratireducens DSM 14787]|uniref:5-formyltetrahydrofolate cyclo-ligase n=1 Tax=Thioalkalivibrio nitratireducens (strain DSM 14787 / UNIQEM 213 / ALEN2) TaxID=1255043 RepID=L0DUS1_THIND|nr:5-formyltetrahydrofolate cyclo-ligase [Thioalkalivibrio nitratireducens DSM 14787]
MATTAHAVHAPPNSDLPPAPIETREGADSIRRRLRRERAALSDACLREHSRSICEHARRCLRWLRPGTLAGYFGIRGEIDLTPLLIQQARAGVRIAMPVLDRHRTGRMHFRSWHPGEALCRNAFAIPEPCPAARRIWRREITAVLVPLVAFDAQGHRIGMGGGYYDRYFARRRLGQSRRPRLIGVAHDFQQVAGIAAQPWDVRLDGVITESGWQFFSAD